MWRIRSTVCWHHKDLDFPIHLIGPLPRRPDRRHVAFTQAQTAWGIGNMASNPGKRFRCRVRQITLFHPSILNLPNWSAPTRSQ